MDADRAVTYRAERDADSNMLKGVFIGVAVRVSGYGARRRIDLGRADEGTRSKATKQEDTEEKKSKS